MELLTASAGAAGMAGDTAVVQNGKQGCSDQLAGKF